MIIKTIATRRPEKMENLEPLFWAYFNNKMMILLMMIQNPMLTKSIRSVERQKMFLHDIYHHFLPARVERKYHRAFKWLRLFLERYPDVTASRNQRAVRMVKMIYEGFGLKFEDRFRLEDSSFHEEGEMAC